MNRFHYFHQDLFKIFFWTNQLYLLFVLYFQESKLFSKLLISLSFMTYFMKMYSFYDHILVHSQNHNIFHFFRFLMIPELVFNKQYEKEDKLNIVNILIGSVKILILSILTYCICKKQIFFIISYLTRYSISRSFIQTKR